MVWICPEERQWIGQQKDAEVGATREQTDDIYGCSERRQGVSLVVGVKTEDRGGSWMEADDWLWPPLKVGDVVIESLCINVSIQRLNHK